MKNEDRLPINISIGGVSISMEVSIEDEQHFRKVGKKLDEYFKEFSTTVAMKGEQNDLQDRRIMAMAALRVFGEGVGTSNIEHKIDDMIEKIDDAV